MDNPGLEELLSNAADEYYHKYYRQDWPYEFDMERLFQEEEPFAYLIDVIDKSIQNGGILSPIVVKTNTLQKELFPEQSLDNVLSGSDLYEIFSEEEMKKGEQNKKNCK